MTNRSPQPTSRVASAAAGLVLGAGSLALAGCAELFMPKAPPANGAGIAAASAEDPGVLGGHEHSIILRVAGQPEPFEGATDPLARTGEAQSFLWNGEVCYRAGRCRTDTKLPVGYPRPTPPGAVEIKRYPAVRRAEFTDEGSMGFTGSRGFMPLFRHIQRSDIAMTAPVEMDYRDVARPGDRATSWTMSFLYETPDLGPTGNDQRDPRVIVKDVEPVTVITVGVRGRMSLSGPGSHLQTLHDWLDARPDWEIAGPARTLGYNGPNIPRRDQWWEVQLPIRPSASGLHSATADGSITR